MAEVILVRHGQSQNNSQAEHLRVPDPGLTEIGKCQAIATAAWLKSVRIDHLYCSPFTRSLETMLPIAEAKQMSAKVRSDLFELGGCYSGHEPGKQKGEPGLGRSELRALYPKWIVDQTISDNGWWGRDYETYEQGRLRARQVADWLASDIVHTGGTHLLVIHADFKRLLISAMLASQADSHNANGDPIEVADGAIFNTGVSIFEWYQDRWRVHALNSVEHLPSHLIT